jgi:hypothetical protein
MTLPIERESFSPGTEHCTQETLMVAPTRQAWRRGIVVGLAMLGVVVVLLVTTVPALAVPIETATGVVSVVATLALWLAGGRVARGSRSDDS